MSGLRRTTRREPVYGEQGNRLLQLSRASAGDQYFSYVTWLLKMDGANGSTTFVDSSSYKRTSTAYGAAQLSTLHRKYGPTSGSFNGTNSHIRTAAGSSLTLDSDFTLETWVRPNSTADMMLAGSQAVNNTQLFRLNEGGISGRLSLYDGIGNVFLSIAAGITVNAWQHIAFARNGSITRAFVNGNVVATNTTWTRSLRCDVVGSTWNGSGAAWANAYIDDFRVTKGLCRYVGSFAPPDSFPTS